MISFSILLISYYYCRKLKLSQDNKVIQKYKKFKSEINDSPDPNKFVIDYFIKFSKYKFVPQHYENHPELLFSLIKLEKYYISISRQVPKKQGFKSNNKISVPLENLPNWMQRNYNKEIEKSVEVYEIEENISIEDNNFTQIIRERICDIKNICEKYYKKTNSVYQKYWNILDELNKSTNKKKFIIELAEKFSSFSKKFDPINYRFKPKLIPYIKRFENCLVKIAKQSRIKRKNKYAMYLFNHVVDEN
ncbi:hypothetical protein C2G38_2189109 [Gigaspora rosea]|uniref:Uncharacterized protein n=1 Tax=Gigaspora rosea TaxID=44941 RepID=A0A397VBS5_9GLOM|nr:hypothetical protein C2G38_2189109 [Gigaspora rosea]